MLTSKCNIHLQGLLALTGLIRVWEALPGGLLTRMSPLSRSFWILYRGYIFHLSIITMLFINSNNIFYSRPVAWLVPYAVSCTSVYYFPTLVHKSVHQHGLGCRLCLHSRPLIPLSNFTGFGHVISMLSNFESPSCFLWTWVRLCCSSCPFQCGFNFGLSC